MNNKRRIQQSVRQQTFQIPLSMLDNHWESLSPKKQDMKAKQELIRQELENKNKQLEQIITYKEQRCFNNKRGFLQQKLQNVEQKLDKWQQTRNNIEFIKKAKMKYLFEYYDCQNYMNSSFCENNKLKLQYTKRRNNSFQDFYKTHSQNQPQIYKPQRKVFDIKYQQQIDEMEKQIQFMQMRARRLRQNPSNSYQILVQDQLEKKE